MLDRHQRTTHDHGSEIEALRSEVLEGMDMARQLKKCMCTNILDREEEEDVRGARASLCASRTLNASRHA